MLRESVGSLFPIFFLGELLKEVVHVDDIDTCRCCCPLVVCTDD
jgi:hypothetical protein